MSEGRRSLLVTSVTGPADAPPLIFLHDRYGDYSDAMKLAAGFGDDVRKIAVRSARTQMVAGTDVLGYYWFLGPLERPELTTLGDALFQLEALLLETEAGSGQRVGLVGHGEGGVIALLTGLVWPDVISGVAAIDAPLPANLTELPIEVRPLAGLPVLLAAGPAAMPAAETARTVLSELGGEPRVLRVNSADAAPAALAAEWAATASP
jgi:pimeloyl-ACP methyl ester carboxylesterase